MVERTSEPKLNAARPAKPKLNAARPAKPASEAQPEILRAVSRLGAEHGRPSSGEMASGAHRSQWSFHRLFRSVTGEAPVGFARRVALDRAAARLAAGDDVAIAALAADAGFASHEGFTRAFVRRFGLPPSAHRARGLAGATPAEATEHQRIVEATAPCVGLYRIDERTGKTTMTADMPTGDTAMDVRALDGFSALIMRRRVSRETVAQALGECLPKVFEHIQRSGLTMTSPPFARYPEVGIGTFLVECGMAVADPGDGDATEGIERIDVPPGRAVVAIHKGGYESLGDTYGAIERWLDEQSLKAGGPPWETYLTDPGDHPDPADWRTEITQPLAD
ncbi:MAG: helix-turn-helix domain-containing protein [Actinomycetota bacterium]|nr:helix-turn-helix domain-containing protein [Actinomycetota bacterium]